MSDVQSANGVGDSDLVPLCRTTAEQRQFTSWTSENRADADNGEDGGFSDTSLDRPSDKMMSSVDQDADIFDVAYKKGWEDGLAGLADEQAMGQQSSEALADAIRHLNNLYSDGSYELILSAIESLFRRCAELAVPDPELLQAWAMQLAELVDEDQKGAALVLHPEDIGLIDKEACKLTLRGDETMLRGNLKLDHSGGWIEKGSKVVLDELSALIDEFTHEKPSAEHE